MNFTARIKNIFLQECLLRFQLLKKIATLIYQKKAGIDPNYQAILLSKPKLQKKLALLNKEGIVIFDEIIPEEKIAKILKHLENKKCFDGYRQILDFFPEQAPLEAHVGEYPREYLLQSPEIMEIANDPNILAIVQGYLGGRPLISNITLWWNFPKRTNPQYSQLYHRDFDDVRFLKLFVYLVDVDETSGPHTYIRHTVNHSKFRRPKRLLDDLIDRTFPASDKLIICGKKGTIFLEDTFGIHKGTPPSEKNRLALQVEYFVKPPLGDLKNYRQIPMSGDIAKLRLDPYINQLLYCNFEERS